MLYFLYTTYLIAWNISRCFIGSSFLKCSPWWRHQMETFSALLAICAGNSPVPGEFPTQRLVTRSFDVYFDLRPNKRLSKQSWGWWFETPWHPLWRHRNAGVSPWSPAQDQGRIHVVLFLVVNFFYSDRVPLICTCWVLCDIHDRTISKLFYQNQRRNVRLPMKYSGQSCQIQC